MRRSNPASEIFPLELVSENFPEDVDMRLTTNSLTSSFYVAVCQLVSATPALHAASSDSCAPPCSSTLRLRLAFPARAFCPGLRRE